MGGRDDSMSLQTRILPVDDWPRLDGTELETVYPFLDRLRAHVIVVEEGNAIVGCWAVFPLVHCEGVWIAPAHRGKSAVARHLLKAMRSTARAMGAQAVNTAAVSDEVRAILAGLGATPIGGDHYVLGLGD
jgi:hypothetical protein